MELNDERWRKFLLPGAASLLGAGAGLVLTRTNKLRESLPGLDGVGDLAEDLRSKLSSVSGKGSSNGGDETASSKAASSKARQTLDADELDKRLRQRQERRKERAGR